MIQLPDTFLETVPLPDSEKQLLVHALQQSSPVSIRLNPSKLKSGFSMEKVPWCTEGFYLPERPVFTFDPLFHAGGYYVQEASSMIIGEIVKEIAEKNTIKVVLDLCASPGGKSTHLLSVLPEDSLLICNEVVSARLGALGENISKWGNNNVCITHNDPSHFTALGNLFDLILVDAPCSGEGMFRKEDAALTEWNRKNVDMCSARQKNILENVLPALKPGGFLIYSTCTYNEKENEQNVKFLVENKDLELFHLNSCSGIRRFFPHQIKGEGLFVSVLRRKQDSFSEFKLKKQNVKTISSEGTRYIRNYSAENFTLLEYKEQISFFSAGFIHLTETLKKNLRFYKIGTLLGEQKGKEFVPDHELFLSNHFCKDNFPCFDLNYEDAIRFLSKENISETPEHKGWGCFTYAQLPLGGFKSVPGRINNYFPKDLKIRKKYEEKFRFSLLSL